MRFIHLPQPYQWQGMHGAGSFGPRKQDHKHFGLWSSTPYDVVAEAGVEGLAGKVYVVLLGKLLGNIHHLESAQVVALRT